MCSHLLPSSFHCQRFEFLFSMHLFYLKTIYILNFSSIFFFSSLHYNIISYIFSLSTFCKKYRVNIPHLVYSGKELFYISNYFGFQNIYMWVYMFCSFYLCVGFMSVWVWQFSFWQVWSESPASSNSGLSQP